MPPPSHAADDYFLLFYTCRTGQVVRFTKDSEFQVRGGQGGRGGIISRCGGVAGVGMEGTRQAGQAGLRAGDKGQE